MASKLFAKTNLRKKRELYCSQQEMVSLINANLGTRYRRPLYTHIENGLRSVSTETALTISRLLKCEVDELFESSDRSEDEKLVEEAHGE